MKLNTGPVKTGVRKAVRDFGAEERLSENMPYRHFIAPLLVKSFKYYAHLL